MVERDRVEELRVAKDEVSLENAEMVLLHMITVKDGGRGEKGSARCRKASKEVVELGQ